MTRFFDTILQSEKYLIWLALGVIAAYFLPYIILGENTPLTIPDNMDSNVVWAKMVLDQGGIFSSPSTVYDQAMGGVPRSSLYWYDIRLVWFELFGMYWGYVINKVLMALVGFWGMFLLLKKQLLPEKAPVYIIIGTSLAFALVPHWSFTMSSAGLPLLSYAFLNLRAGKVRTSDWLIIVLYAWYSSLVLSGFFFLIIAGFVLLYDWYKGRGFNKRLFIGMAALSISYVVSHLPLFYSFLFDSDFVSHRVEFDGWAYNLKQVISSSLVLLFKGHFLARSMSTLIWIPIIVALYLGFVTKKQNKRVYAMLAFLILTTLLYGMLYWEKLDPYTILFHHILPIHLYRFFYLHPLVWYMLMGISLYTIHQYFRDRSWINPVIGLFILVQVFMVARYHEAYMNRQGPSFKQFYASSQLNSVKEQLGPEGTWKVVSIGLNPAAALYNGFHTIDGYFANYPLAHKTAFREIIRNEIADAPGLQNHFEGWGSQCYAYVTQIGRKFDYPAIKDKTTLDQIDYSWDAALALGATHVLSAFPIDTIQNPRLSLLTTAIEPGAYWDIYVYAIR